MAGVGDIDHPSTLSFQTCPGVVQGLTFENAQRGSQDPEILKNLKQVVDKMEAEESFGIAGNCGFMHFYQEFVRDYATVPVFMSALVQVPAMAAALEPDERRSTSYTFFSFPSIPQSKRKANCKTFAICICSSGGVGVRTVFGM